jgi:enoyl-CoA hydratase
MSFENLLIENKGRIQYIIINRESKLNALNAATLEELGNAINAALNDNTVGGIIITGAGEKAFVAGADIAEFGGLDETGGLAMAKRGHSVFSKIENGSKPVIAAINGFALGGGLELAMACHIRIASENVKLGLPEVSLGLIPGYGGTQRLTRLVGKGKAMEIIMTGDMISVGDAFQIGLVNHVVGQTDLKTKAEEILNKILTRAPLAISAAINAVNAAEIEINGNEIELKNFSKLFNSADLKEGISAFIDKKKPNFKGI